MYEIKFMMDLFILFVSICLMIFIVCVLVICSSFKNFVSTSILFSIVLIFGLFLCMSIG